MGRTEEARAALVEWWDGDREDAPRRDLQRGLWLRGRLTVDPVQADRIIAEGQADLVIMNEVISHVNPAFLDTVWRETPARSATSASVGGAAAYAVGNRRTVLPMAPP